jgi:hypothetical protein
MFSSQRPRLRRRPVYPERMVRRVSTGAFGVLLALVAVAACGSDGGKAGFVDEAGTGDDGGVGLDAPNLDETGFNLDSGGGGDAQGFDVSPAAVQTITVAAGQQTPTIAYAATTNGAPVSVAWSLDRGDIGTIAQGPSSSAAFTPTGTTGGLATIRAGYNGKLVTRQVMVKLTAQQNGANPSAPGEPGQIPGSVGGLSAGGGVGGVGGEGLGPPVTDPGTIGALGGPQSNGSAQQLGYLYPYDKTIWSRGMLAPLLMWTSTLGDADGLQIELATTSGSFSYKGTFARPAILGQTGGKFIRHPIPQDVWDMATNTAGAPTLSGAPDQLTVKVTIALGGQGYGPISETWSIAPARLSGTVYYNVYGTQLVKNWTALDGAGHSVGAAILGIRSGQLGPTLVVGQNSPTNAQGNPADDSGCRVCHVVASRGRWLVTQSEQGVPGDGRSFLYDLTAPNVQASVAQIPQEGVFTWAGMTSDGAYALSNTIDPSSSNPSITGSVAGTAKSALYSFGPAPALVTSFGLPPNVAAGYPSFSPDDKKAAYIDVTGKTQDVQGALVVADYDATTRAFSNVHTLATPVAGQRIGYPVFLPDNSGIVYETEVRSSQSDTVMVTRNGARSELWWVSLAANAQPVRLDALNGKAGAASYLPSLPNNHGIAGATDPESSYNETGLDDTTLNYEPTVLPIAVGGKAWVVFTSRRAYGSQLGSVPWRSWPPSYDTTNLAQSPTKKLWVAAIDLGAAPTADPSHPAFYLPAQEILAGNSRGFWVLDPCKQDGQSCQTGDQCCNGYCEANGDGGALVCSNTPPNNQCSKTQEKCKVAADCCDATESCINGFCSQSVK